MQTCEMPLVAKRLRGRTKERGSGGLATKVTAISGRCAFMGAGWTGTVKGSRMPLGCARMTPGRVAEDASVLSTPRLFGLIIQWAAASFRCSENIQLVSMSVHGASS